ncbi:MAG: hypothetical protein ACLPX7_20365 [Xanthobacteraceae bacterium]
MRFADNFNPEWGYLAPAPSFMHTARVAIVAAAIGATSGAAVVFSLIDRPAAEETSIAARTLVQQGDAAFVVPPAAAQLQAPHEVGSATNHRGGPHLATLPASEAGRSSSKQNPGNVLALAEAPAAIASTPPANQPVVAADTPSVQKKAAKRQPQPQQRLTWRAPREQVYGAAREQAYGAGRTPFAALPNGAYLSRGWNSGAYQARDDF